jgi:hypothetical protein
VESLARPGGNLTGFSLIEFSVIGKMVETLKQMAPGISRVGIIYNPDNPVGAVYLNSFKAVAAQLAVQAINLPVHGPADIERAIGSLAEELLAKMKIDGERDAGKGGDRKSRYRASRLRMIARLTLWDTIGASLGPPENL